MNDFVHLHLYSEYSLLESSCKIKETVQKVKSLGQTAVAITDRGVLFGAVEFYKECKKNGIKPIIGCELPTGEVVLCKNNQGYHNLIKIVSDLSLNNPSKTSENIWQDLIVLSGGTNGRLYRMIESKDYEAANSLAKKCKQRFNGDYYIELLGDADKTDNAKLINIANQNGIDIVSANQVCYINQNDADIHQILGCIKDGITISPQNAIKVGDRYIKSADEMDKIFGEIENSLNNTLAIASKCNIDLEFGAKKLPEYKYDGNHFEYLKSLCRKGLKLKYGDKPSKVVIDRIEYELNTIYSMGYVDYYLIVWDFINYARSKGISVGPGRGSGAGSIVAYLIGITGIDPIKHNLIFERFLNPERVSMPDFDIDFCYVRRQEVIDYLYEKYGSDHVAQIVTFGTLAAKAAVKDVGRALDLPYNYVELISKMIPNEPGITLEKAIENSERLKKLINEDYTAKQLINIAKRVEGLPRHCSTHAAGVVITGDKVNNYIPVTHNPDGMMTQYTMTLLEELGLLKIDLLGLRNLTIIDDAVKLIQSNNPDFSIETIDLNDELVFDMFSKGNTEGVFQFESDGMKSVLKRLKPSSLEDIIAVISLYRPGPMDSISKYIQNRHNPQKIKYLTPELKPILEVTYGCMIYQEQVMQIFRDLAGYSYGKADIVRRAMSKKKRDVMENERTNFISGAEERGISKNISEKIFDEMTSFASYAFNKSHAAAYALLAYRTAWLKCHYPFEYMSALLTSVCGNVDKISRYGKECDKLGVKIFAPDVNMSEKYFVPKNGGIQFPLSTIKNVGTLLSDLVVDNRVKYGNFTSLHNFCNRVNGRELNQKSLEWLIKSGSFDGIESNRRQAFVSSEKILSNIQNRIRSELKGQINFLGNEIQHQENKEQAVSDYNIGEKSEFELSSIGIAFSKHLKSTVENNTPVKKSKYPGLHLRLKSEEYIDRKKVDNLLSIFEGTTPVYYKFEDSGKRVMLPRSMFITPNEPLLKELCKLLGEENVVFIK